MVGGRVEVIDENRLVDQFLRFVRVDSPSGQEAEFGDLVRAELEGVGIPSRFDRAARHLGGTGNNLMAHLPGVTGGLPLLINAHLDTVAAGAAIAPEITDGVIRSRGDTIVGADDKAAIAAILEALRAVRAATVPYPAIDLVFTVSEEVGLRGARVFDCSHLSARVGYVVDSHGPVGGIVVSAPTHDVLYARITGRAAHAGMEPEAGISAIQIAAHAINEMRLGRVDDETTANIGVIEGGTGTNVIPQRVDLKGEARSHDETKLHQQTAHMRQCLRRAAREFGGKVRSRIEHQYRAFRMSADQEVVALASAAARKIGVEPDLRSSGGGSDANIFNERGIPTVVLAAGYEHPHSPEESIAVEQLTRLAEWLVAIITLAAEWRA